MAKFTLTRVNNRQAGIGLIELMIAMLLGIILIGSVFQTLLGNMKTFHTNNGLARVQEGARFATNELARDIRMAGFVGCESSLDAQNVKNNTGNTLFDFSAALSGTNGGTDAQPDTLQVKQLVSVNAHLTAAVAAGANSLTLSSAEDFKNGDVLYLGDCSNGVVIHVNVSNNTLNLVNSAGTSIALGTSFNQSASVYKMEVKKYSIAASTYTLKNGTAINALMVSVNGAANSVVALGVDNLQVLYGHDTDDDFSPNQFTATPAPAQLDKTTVVRLLLKTSNYENSHTPMDREFTLSVTLRNRLVAGI
jgi:type IV pilus assembly protein PilW